MKLEYRHSSSELLALAVVKADQTDLGLVDVHLEKSSTGRRGVGRLHYPGRKVGLYNGFTLSVQGVFNPQG